LAAGSAVHLGHHHIGHDEIDLAEVAVERLDRSKPFAAEHGITREVRPRRIKAAQASRLRPEDCALPGVVRGFRCHLAGAGAAPASARQALFPSGFRRIGPWDMAGQKDTEGRALSDCRFQIDEAAVCLTDAVDRRESEPGALADLLVEKNGSKM